MSNDERPDSLAAQAAAWVPPWERPRSVPDRAYQAAQRAEAEAEAEADADDVAVEGDPAAEADDVAAESEDVAAAIDIADEAAPATEDAVADVDAPVAEDEPASAIARVAVGLAEEPAEGVSEDAEVPAAPAPLPGEVPGPAMVDAPLPMPDEDPTPAGVVPDADVPELSETGSVVPPQSRRRRDEDAAVGGATSRTNEEFDPSGESPAAMDDAELAGALEAIMLVVDQPVAELQLSQILQQPAERVAAMLDDLSARYTAAGHGFDLRRVAGGWRLYTRPEYAVYVERFVLDGQSVRLTQAALETLAVVAYKQPVTRSRISAIRGVNCDGVMRTLVTRGLIEECGVEGETGAHLYRTTPMFLEKLGINSVDELPPLAPFLPDDVEEVLDASG